VISPLVFSKHETSEVGQSLKQMCGEYNIGDRIAEELEQL